MNTIGNKMNNKLTNVMGSKFSNKIHTMGHKMMPIIYGQPMPMMNIMMPDKMQYDKKIMSTKLSQNTSGMKKMKYKSRLTK